MKEDGQTDPLSFRGFRTYDSERNHSVLIA
jgi:hypothetical protein